VPIYGNSGVGKPGTDGQQHPVRPWSAATLRCFWADRRIALRDHGTGSRGDNH
jgi:hypothetical protein